MLADRQIHPPPATNFRGEPYWEGSAAQKILKKNVADGVHRGMRPADYYKLRPEFQQFLPKTIAGHVIQEERLIKFYHQYPKRFQNH